MDKKTLAMDKRLHKIDAQLERMATAIVKGFGKTNSRVETVEANLKSQIDIYARAVAAYAKQSETYMQEC